VVLVWWSAASDRREQSLAELVGNNVFSFINREGQRNYVRDFDFFIAYLGEDVVCLAKKTNRWETMLTPRTKTI
jgi:hypothetical protein